MRGPATIDPHMRERVLTRLDWALPAPPVERSVMSRLPAEDTGRPPILFIHGLGHGAWAWEPWMDAAAESGWPSYAVDLRGHGDSEGRQLLRRTTLRHYVHDVLQTITELPAPPVLVGHSMGGLVVQHVLERYPARAGVLVAPIPAHGGLGVAARIGRSRPDQLLRAAALRPIRLRADQLFSALDEPTARRHEARQTPDSPLVQLQLTLPRRPRPSKAPVLVLGAGDDAIIPPVDVQRTAAHYGRRARMFRGLGHDLMLEPDAKWPLQVMLEWLDDTVPR